GKLSVLDVDPPARDGIERRRPDGLSRREIEAGVMPRAAYRPVGDQALIEWSAVMRALRVDGEQLALPSRDEHVVVADVSAEHAAFGHLGQGDTCRQIRTRWCPLTAHVPPSIEPFCSVRVVQQGSSGLPILGYVSEVTDAEPPHGPGG